MAIRTLQPSCCANAYRYERLLEDLASDDPQGSLRRATALFSLIALADRPLKTYEAVDGIVLCEHPYQLNESTKLTPRELDRCKPLIEIDTSGNVSFVHFTVKEYNSKAILNALNWLADFGLDIFWISPADRFCDMSRHYAMLQWPVSPIWYRALTS